MQHAINKLDDKKGRAAIITNGSPLLSGELPVARVKLEEKCLKKI